MPESVYFIDRRLNRYGAVGCVLRLLWLMVCDALDEQRCALQVAPAVVRHREFGCSRIYALQATRTPHDGGRDLQCAALFIKRRRIP